MSSHDNTVDGAIGFGALGIGGRTAIGDPMRPNSMIAEAAAAGAMTLDEAESIAARRLEELAIRLGDGDTDSSDDEPGLVTFDADRHLRTRLARRIASLDDDDDWRDDARTAAGAETNLKPLAETGICARYVVTEALPLAAFGTGLAALSTMRSGQPAPADDEAPVGAAEPMALAEGEQTGEGRDDALTQTVAAVPDSAMRLVDLIKEQRLLLDRLGRLDGLPWADASLPAVGLEEMMARAQDPSEALRSDAEELFEAGTYAAPSELEADDGPDPVSISAEQLIAALNQTTPDDEDQDKPEPEIETASAVEGVASNLLHDLVDREAAPRLQFVLHQPNPLPGPVVAADPASRPVPARAFEQHRLLPAPDLTGDADPERSPIIIERARAEMSALANGAGSLHAVPPSAAIGFFAGLSLSLVCGVMLYFVL